MQEAIQNQTTLPRPGQGAPMSHVTLAQSICLTTPQLQSKYFYGQQRSIFEMLLAGEGKTLRNKRGNGKRNLRQTDLFMVFCLVSDRNLTKLTKTYCLKYNVHSLQNNGCTWWCFFCSFLSFWVHGEVNLFSSFLGHPNGVYHNRDRKKRPNLLKCPSNGAFPSR